MTTLDIDTMPREFIYEVRNSAAQDTLELLIEQWERHPKRKGALNDVRRIHARFVLEREKANADLSRPDLRRARNSALTYRPNSKTKGRIREWLINIFGVLLVLGFLSALCTFAAAFNPLYDSTQTTITD